MPAQILPAPPTRRSGVADLARGLSSSIQTMAGFALRYKQMAIQTALAQQKGVELELQAKLTENRIQESQYNQSLLRSDVKEREATLEGSIKKIKAEDVAATKGAELKGAQSKALLGKVDDYATQQYNMGEAALAAIIGENKAKEDLNLRTQYDWEKKQFTVGVAMLSSGVPKQVAYGKALMNMLNTRFPNGIAGAVVEIMDAPWIEGLKIDQGDIPESDEEITAKALWGIYSILEKDPSLISRENFQWFQSAVASGTITKQMMETLDTSITTLTEEGVSITKGRRLSDRAIKARKRLETIVGKTIGRRKQKPLKTFAPPIKPSKEALGFVGR